MRENPRPPQPHRGAELHCSPSPFPLLTTSMAMPMRHPRFTEHHRVQWRRNVRDDGKELRGNCLGHKARDPGQLPSQCPAPLPPPPSPPSPLSTASPPSQPPSIAQAHHPWVHYRPIHWTSAPSYFTSNLQPPTPAPLDDQVPLQSFRRLPPTRPWLSWPGRILAVHGSGTTIQLHGASAHSASTRTAPVTNPAVNPMTHTCTGANDRVRLPEGL